jgi:prefoldin subunit 5
MTKHQKEIEELSAHIDELQGKLKDFEKTKEALEKVKAELHSTETAKQWLERQLSKTEVCTYS